MKIKIITFFMLLFSMITIIPALAYDYTQNCNTGGSCSCYSTGQICYSNPQCLANSCSYSCPSAKSNSALIGNSCTPGTSNTCSCNLITNRCYAGKTCTCTISGTCGYNCNEGYVWDGDSCEPDNSCTPTPGSDWIIDCSDNCNMTSGSVNVDRLIFTGTGTVTFTNYDVGYSQRIVDHNCRIIRDYASTFILG